MRGCAVVAVLAAAAASPAAAGIRIVDEGVSVDRDRGVASFDLRFDAVPDFFTVDEFGRVADSFQYEIDADAVAPSPLMPFEEIDAVVRGDEISAADALRIRAGLGNGPPDPDPLAGGWGAVRAAVPFDLDGTQLRFDVPLDVLGDDDGQFAYRVFTTEFGLTTSEVQGATGAAVGIPLPPATWTAGATVAGFALFAALRRVGAR